MGDVELSNNKIHVFYLDKSNLLQGKILSKGGRIESHNLTLGWYPAVLNSSKLTAFYYPTNGDIKLWYQTTENAIQTLYYTEKGGWVVDSVAVAAAFAGTAMSVMSWDRDSSGAGAASNRLVRLLYADANQMFMQFNTRLTEDGASVCGIFS